jgi:hypothetical protein
VINIFDLSIVNMRYFEIKLKVPVDKIVDEAVTKIEKEIVLELEPPTKKMLNKIIKLRKEKEEDIMDNLYEAVWMILNKNKTGKKISVETVDKINIDLINAILTAYFEWLNKEQNSPN